jgi:hypothetical protein
MNRWTPVLIARSVMRQTASMPVIRIPWSSVAAVSSGFAQTTSTRRKPFGRSRPWIQYYSLSYYVGLCLGCCGTIRQQHPTNSAWLR